MSKFYVELKKVVDDSYDIEVGRNLFDTLVNDLKGKLGMGCPTGIDTMSVVVHTDHLNPVREAVMEEISSRLHPDILKVEDGLAMIAVVGEGMVFSKGTAAGIFQAISDAGVNIRMIDQGSSEMNIIIGVQEEDYALAVNSIYQNVIKTK